MTAREDAAAAVADLAKRTQDPSAPPELLTEAEDVVSRSMVVFGLDPADPQHRLGVFAGMCVAEKHIGSEAKRALLMAVAAVDAHS